jgi:diaminopimelate decarboxylase
MILPPDIEKQIRDLAAQNPARRSFYLYNTAPMRNKIAQLKAVLPDSVDIYYAMKANPHEAFLATAKQAGVRGIEIASLGEGKKALAAGFKASDIIFTGPGKSPEELEWSVDNKICKVHIESLTEAHRLNQICAERNMTQDILVRVNPNFDIHGAQAKFSGDSSKLGIDEDVFRKVLADILALENLNFKGLHVYAASGVLKVEDLLENCRRVFTLAREIEANYPDLSCEIIDFGGGFGIDYLETGADFSVETYAGELQKLIEKFNFSDRKFVLELGRYLTADSGWYITEILDIKESLGKKQVICDGGAHHFRRPVALGINHPLMIVPMNREDIYPGQESVNDEMVFIGGPLCNTADKLAPKDIYIEKARIGDMAVFGLAGAYGKTMSHLDFLSHDHPEEIVIN